MAKKSVCIIGGGPAGLVSLKTVLQSTHLTGTLFEQNDDVGGIWHYRQGEKGIPVSKRNLNQGMVGKIEYEDPACTTTMYDDLTSNLPYPLMEFQDFPHANPPRTFLTREEMHSYLREYTTYFNLWPNIQLNTSIVSVRPEIPITPENYGMPGRWIVETHNLKDDTFSTTVYDAVMVCNGKNIYPYQPHFPGIETFGGKVMHCKYFRNAEELRGKTIVCIGLGPSSADMALHLSKTAKWVTVCHKFTAGFGLGILPENVNETKNVKLVTEAGVVTEEDEEIPCDVIIFCTGYKLGFPFFREGEGSGIELIEDKYVPNFYKMTVFTKRPSLAILNLSYRAVEIIVVGAQAKYFVSMLVATIKLPSFAEMDESVKREEEEKRKKGIPVSLWLQIGEFGTGAWKYFEDMCEEGRFKEDCDKWPLLECLIMRGVLPRFFGKCALYSGDRFRKIGEYEWECLFNSGTGDEKRDRMKMTLEKETRKVIVEEEQISV